ncbi:MAG TPA: potassium-transporting ATPase subunit KdpC [Ktedonobacterales bacterium]|jgi:K+-transporting ATPase ATPase C chain
MSKQPQNNQPRRKNGDQSQAGSNKVNAPKEETSAEVSQQATGKAAETEHPGTESDSTAAVAELAPRGRRQLILDYLRPAIVLTLVMTVILGIAYPLLVTGVAQVVFNHQANGSLVTDQHGQVIGSSLIGQQWTDPKYFHGRPSATLSNDGSQSQPYNAANSSASNNGPTSSNLQAEVQAQLKVLQEDEACNAPGTPIPVDLVTSSGSGLDPDISVAGAMYQACRIAKERNMSLNQVQQLISSHIHDRTLGVLGEPYINVLELNMALDGGS